ncbi:MAG: DUF4476 domain-containing protein [Myxococcota bacterium]
MHHRLFRLAVLAVLMSVSIGFAGTALAQHHGPPPPQRARPSAQVRQEVAQQLAWIEDHATRLDEAALAPCSPQTRGRIGQLVAEIRRASAALRGLQVELVASIEAEFRPIAAPHHPPVGEPPPAPMPPSTPEAMAPDAFRTFLQTLNEEGIESNRMGLLRDSLASGIRLNVEQAVTVMKAFTFGSNQVDAAALMCPALTEPGALVRFTSTLTFESDRKALRKKLSGGCGPK